MSKNGFEAAAQGEQVSWRFQEITRTAPDNIVGQLVGHDRVHTRGVQSIEDLRVSRLGGADCDRSCFALIGADSTVHSAIYVYKAYDHVAADNELHGDVAGILAEQTREDRRVPKSLIFYSISNITNMPMAGQNLVSELYRFLNETYPHAKRSTLSPIRDFDRDFTPVDHEKFAALSNQDKVRSVLNYLISAKDGVQKFHMGNGARIADIKLDAGDYSVDRESNRGRRHVAMVNFAYDMDETTLLANAKNYNGVKMLLRDQEMDPLERAIKIRDRIMPLVSQTVLRDAGMLSDFSAPSWGAGTVAAAFKL